MSHPPETVQGEKKSLAHPSEYKQAPSQSKWGAKCQLQGHIHRGPTACENQNTGEDEKFNHLVNLSTKNATVPKANT